MKKELTMTIHDFMEVQRGNKTYEDFEAFNKFDFFQN